MDDKIKLGWLVGFFDGEGTIELCNANGVALTIDSTDYDCVQRFQETYGGSIHARPVRASSPKAQWRWKLGTANEVHRVLTDWYPLLSKRRRAKADDAFTRLLRNKNLTRRLRGEGRGERGE
jgi:hypothetical protein